MKNRSVGRYLQFVLFVCSTSCATVFLQNDGFADKLKLGCKSERECRQLQLEADQRIVKCQDNTVGYVRCSDARADKLVADSYVKEYEDVRQHAEQDKANAQRQAQVDERNDARSEQLAQTRAAQAERHREDSEREQKAIAAQVERYTKVSQTCDATKDARASAKKHADMRGSSGVFLRQHCTPNKGMRSVQSPCVDANGFTRTCTKQVPGDVVGYSCPKGTDPDLVKIGLFEMELLEDYPFPEERRLGVTDSQCEQVSATLTELQAKQSADPLGPGGRL